jgi:hypothetical protein
LFSGKSLRSQGNSREISTKLRIKIATPKNLKRKMICDPILNYKKSNHMKTCFAVLLLMCPSLLFAGDIPENAHPTILGTGWECDKGYYRAGQRCEKLIVPENAHLNYFGNGWECDKGYYKLGQRCEKVIVPENAHLNYFGNGWECDKGYKKLGNSCVPMTKEELQKQKALEEEFLKRMQESKMRGVTGDDCKTEYKTNAEVCVRVTGVDLNCNKNFLGNYYRDCDATLSYDVKTNYSGGSYLDVKVECTIEIEYRGRQTYLTQSDSDRRDESHTLYAHESNSETMRFDFSFSSYKEVYRVRVSSAKCEIESVDLW